jgi:hypothetical protein
MHIINESRKFPMAGPMDIDVTHSRSITANEDDEVAKSPSHLIQQQNGFLSRRLSRVLVTPTNDEVNIWPFKQILCSRSQYG